MRSLILLITGALVHSGAAYAQDTSRDEAAFTEHVATLLRKEVGEAAVVVKSPLTLGLGELQANLDRVFAFCRRDVSGCQAEVDRYVKAAADVHKDRTAPPTREAVRVIVRTAAYAQSGGAGAPIQTQPRPFVDGLVALPALDSRHTLRMLGEKDNAQLGLTSQEVYELGLANLRRTLAPLMSVAKVAGPGQIGNLVGDTFHPSRLLLHDSWAPLAQAQGGVLVVAIPATDAVFYIGDDKPASLDALRTLVQNVIGRAPNRLSPALLRWKESGWELVR